MDLSTIKSNVQNGVYKTLDAFAVDIQQIWTNCKLYNQQGSPIYIQAEKLERKSKKLIKKLKSKFAGGSLGLSASLNSKQSEAK